MAIHELKSDRKGGFTLVELLVVIGIIALLISILLPTLNKAKKAAQTVVCLSNLRSIGEGMRLYAAQNNDYIIGSPITTGLQCFDSSFASAMTIPTTGAMQSTDWCGPMCQVLHIRMPQLSDYGGTAPGNDPNLAGARYRLYTSSKLFTCPSNSFTELAYTSSPVNIGALPALGYVTAFSFMILPANAQGGSQGYTKMYSNTASTGWWTIPTGYVPKVSKVHHSNDKIFAGCGIKFSDGSKIPDYNLKAVPDNEGNDTVPGLHRNSTQFSDWGAPFNSTAAYDPGYDNHTATTPSLYDGRLLSMNHGRTVPGQPLGDYKMNAVFYDGHAETLTGIDATDIRHWVQSGAVFSNGKAVPPDVQAVHPMLFPGGIYTSP